MNFYHSIFNDILEYYIIIFCVIQLKIHLFDKIKSKYKFYKVNFRNVRFYIGYLNAEAPDGYLSTVVTSTLRGIVAESDHRQNRMLFKLAVELAMLQNVVAASSEFDPQSLERLRGECVREVKRLNGGLSLEDACRWQREE